ncbi:MAG: hypothetical protein KDK07_22175 [Bauldia sp.]|nr:hypothetical protein [Bauldia sp.]
MPSRTIERRNVLFVDKGRGVGLLQLPIDSFPSGCEVNTPYSAILQLAHEATTCEWPVLFEMKPATTSFGRSIPPLAWVIVVGVTGVGDVADRTYGVMDVREATPSEVANTRSRLAGKT